MGASPTARPTAAGTGDVLRTILAPLLLYLALAVVLTSRAWEDPTSTFIGGCCDQQQAMWFLRWIPTILERGGDPFFTAEMNAPDGVNLMWNSAMPAISLLMTPVTLVAGPVVAYNISVVLAIGTAAWAAYLLIRRYVGGTLGPVIGGLVYGFSPYVIGHATLHLNLTIVWAPPVMLLLLDELVVRRRYGPGRIGVAIGILAAIQLLIFEEVLATMVVAAAVLALVTVLVVRDRAAIGCAAARVARAAVPAALSFAVIAAWPLAVQFFGPQRIEAQLQDVGRFSTDLLNVLLPTPNQLLAPEAATAISRTFSGSLYHEATAYIGLPLLLVVVLTVVLRWADLRVRIAGLTALAMLVLSLGPRLRIGDTDTGIPLPWLPFTHLPLIEHALPGRLSLYMYLAIAVVVAVAIEQLARRRSPRKVAALVAVGIAIAVVVPRPFGAHTTETPAFFQAWDASVVPDDAIVLVAPHFTNGAGAAPMLWASVAGNRPRLYEAYAYVPREDGSPSYGPPGTQLTRIMETIQDHGTTVVARGGVRAQVLRELQERSISHVVVGPLEHREQMVTFFTDLLDGAPLQVGGVQLWDLRPDR